MKDNKAHENWGSRLGVILAVSGSAIGLGNFIRFPGQAATHGGGAFMIPYLVALLIVAIPIAASEWSLGRYGGVRGFHSPMGIYYVAGKRRRIFGICGGMTTFTAYVIDMYYLFIEAWCAFYALQYLGAILKPLGLGFSLIPGQSSGIALGTSEDAFTSMCGINADGSLFSSSGAAILTTLACCVAVNFLLVYKGIAKGIERFCKAVAPLILICSLVIVVRVLTLGNPTGQEGQSLFDGLGFMWNPKNVGKTLADPEVWLAATSQIFFSTSLCTSAVLTYTSYIRKKQDVALSSMTATMANEFCEVCLGGLMIIPPAIMFLGTAAADKIGSSFSLGFIVLPDVFSKMPLGEYFGFIFFSLLFFAAITSSVSQLQPAVAFVKEAFRWSHKTCVMVVASMVLIGAAIVCWFTADLVALDTFDFWSANFTPFLCAIIQTSLVAFILGKKAFREELDRGAICKTSRWISPLVTFVTIPYLAIIFVFWLTLNFKGQIAKLTQTPSALLSTVFLLIVLAVITSASIVATKRWKKEELEETKK